jgi:hypothetical protein
MGEIQHHARVRVLAQRKVGNVTVQRIRCVWCALLWRVSNRHGGVRQRTRDGSSYTPPVGMCIYTHTQHILCAGNRSPTQCVMFCRCAVTPAHYAAMIEVRQTTERLWWWTDRIEELTGDRYKQPRTTAGIVEAASSCHVRLGLPLRLVTVRVIAHCALGMHALAVNNAILLSAPTPSAFMYDVCTCGTGSIAALRVPTTDGGRPVSLGVQVPHGAIVPFVSDLSSAVQFLRDQPVRVFAHGSPRDRGRRSRPVEIAKSHRMLVRALVTGLRVFISTFRQSLACDTGAARLLAFWAAVIGDEVVSVDGSATAWDPYYNTYAAVTRGGELFAAAASEHSAVLGIVDRNDDKARDNALKAFMQLGWAAVALSCASITEVYCGADTEVAGRRQG